MRRKQRLRDTDGAVYDPETGERIEKAAPAAEPVIKPWVLRSTVPTDEYGQPLGHGSWLSGAWKEPVCSKPSTS